MKTEFTFLSTQFCRVYNGDPWYGPPIQNVLQSFPSAHAFDHPAPELHSAAELLSHIIAYRQFLNNRLGSDDGFPPDQEATFNWKKMTKNQTDAWGALLEQLAASHEQLLDLLIRQDDTLLDEPVSGKPYDFRYLLYGIIQHDIYHLGQLSYIKRFYEGKQKSKEPLRKSSFLPDLTSLTLKNEDSYKFFSYEGMSFSK